jgi:hypothetical protein
MDLKLATLYFLLTIAGCANELKTTTKAVNKDKNFFIKF